MGGEQSWCRVRTRFLELTYPAHVSHHETSTGTALVCDLGSLYRHTPEMCATGPDVITKFLQKFDLDLIARAHQVSSMKRS